MQKPKPPARQESQNHPWAFKLKSKSAALRLRANDGEQQCCQHVSCRFWQATKEGCLTPLAVLSDAQGQREERGAHPGLAAEVKLEKPLTAPGSMAAAPPVPFQDWAWVILAFQEQCRDNHCQAALDNLLSNLYLV